MGKLREFIGFDAWLGDQRKLDEALGMRDIYVTQIEHKRRDWQEAEKCLPDLDKKIAELREKIAKRKSQ